MSLIKLFQNYKSIGIVGSPNSAKSSLVLTELIDMKSKIDVDIYVLGAEPSLYDVLEFNNINILYSSDDVLDMKIKNSVIYIDEFASIFDVSSQSKQRDRIKRFFNRIEHLNNYVIVSSAEINFWNKFMCSIVKAHLVKRIEFNNLVRGTDLKRKIQNIAENTSDYRLDIKQNEYYIITDDNLVLKRTFKYNPSLDSKKNFINPFLNYDLKSETEGELE